MKSFSTKRHGGLIASVDFPVLSETFLHILAIQGCIRIPHAFRSTRGKKVMTGCAAV